MFKKKLRFINPVPGIAEAYPVIKAKDFKRDWVDKNNKEVQLFHQTLKTCPITRLKSLVQGAKFIGRCPGIRSFMNTGYIVTLPFDVVVETYGDGVKFNAEHFAPTSEHVTLGVNGFAKESFHDYVNVPQNSLKTVLKIDTGWRVVPDSKFVFLCGPMHYSGESRFTTVTGILDPYISSELNIAMYWHVLQGREILKAGTPILQLIPIPRDLLQPEPISDTGLDKLNTIKSVFNISNNSVNKDYLNIRKTVKKLWGKLD